MEDRLLMCLEQKLKRRVLASEDAIKVRNPSEYVALGRSDHDGARVLPESVMIESKSP
jgi:hypothetical protein